jgi:RNA polymerase sigma-70 factor (ECF subfamily)
MQEDKKLIRQLKKGRTEAMKQIYKKYKRPLLKTAIILINDTHLAEDIVQDVFINFAQRTEQLKTTGNLKNYLITAVINNVRNRIRNGNRLPITTLDDADILPAENKSCEQWAILNEELEILKNAMCQIPYEQREVITLYMEGRMTFRQIAEFEETTVSTVQGRFRYGIEKLRKFLKSEVEK